LTEVFVNYISKITPSTPPTTTLSNTIPLIPEIAVLKAEVASFKGLAGELASIEELLLQLVKDKSS